MANNAETGGLEFDQEVYDTLYGRVLSTSTRFDRMVSGGPGALADARLEDITDSFERYQTIVGDLFPDTEPGIRAGIVTACAVFERMGCESGIMFQAGQMSHGYDSDASFRRRVTEGIGY